jgi:hypothetical protein
MINEVIPEIRNIIINEWLPLNDDEKLEVINKLEEIIQGIELVKSNETQETTIQIITTIYNKWQTLPDKNKLDKIKLLEDTIAGITLIQDSDNPEIL